MKIAIQKKNNTHTHRAKRSVRKTEGGRRTGRGGDLSLIRGNPIPWQRVSESGPFSPGSRRNDVSGTRPGSSVSLPRTGKPHRRASETATKMDLLFTCSRRHNSFRTMPPTSRRHLDQIYIASIWRTDTDTRKYWTNVDWTRRRTKFDRKWVGRVRFSATQNGLRLTLSYRSIFLPSRLEKESNERTVFQ